MAPLSGQLTRRLKSGDQRQLLARPGVEDPLWLAKTL